MPDFDPGDCMFLASKLERIVKPSTKVRPSMEDEGGNCVIDLTKSYNRRTTTENPMARYASVRFSQFPNGPGLVESDIPVNEYDADKIRKLIAGLASTCDIEDVHLHTVVQRGPRKGHQYHHFHLSDCSLADLGKVLKEAGY